MFATIYRTPTRAERCGMFIGTATHNGPPRHARLYELPNRAETPESSYRVAQDDVNAALAHLGVDDTSILGFWHTHPSPYLPGPSEDDWEGIRAGSPQWMHCVFHVQSQTRTWYRTDGFLLTERDW